MAINAALRAGFPPSAWITRSGKDQPWRGIDYLLLEAKEVLELETCPECGQPLWYCRSHDSNLKFKVSKTKCEAKAALEKWDDKNRDKDGKSKLKPGEIPRLEKFMVDIYGKKDIPLPTREEWYEHTKGRV